MTTRVVNRYAFRNHGLEKVAFIGRIPNTDQHYGNPFSHLDRPNLAEVHVNTREESIEECENWLRGRAWTQLEQERRRWILAHLEDLRDAALICFCAPQPCHGDIYVKLLDEARLEQ